MTALLGEVYAATLTGNAAITVPKTWVSGPGGNLLAGTLAVIRLATVNSGGVYSCVDSKGNQWTPIGPVNNTANVCACATLYSVLQWDLMAGADTFTPEVTGNWITNHSIQLTAFSGVVSSPYSNAALALDGTGGVSLGVDQATGGSASAWSTESGSGLVTANANDLLLACCAYQGSGGPFTTTPSGGFINESQGLWDSSNDIGLITAYQIVSAAGTYSTGGTFSTNENGWAAQLVALGPGVTTLASQIGDGFDSTFITGAL